MSVSSIWIAFGVLVAASVGFFWYQAGGIPRDHDRYGTLALGREQRIAGLEPGGTSIEDLTRGGPAKGQEALRRIMKQQASGKELRFVGRKRVNLPAGEVRLNYEGNVQLRGGTGPEGSELAFQDDPPESLRVTVRPAGGGRPLELKGAGGTAIFIGNSGWTTYKRVDVPEAGPHVVRANGPADTAPIAIGKAFWNPFGSRVAGAILAAILFLLVEAAIFGSVIFGGFGRRRSQRVAQP